MKKHFFITLLLPVKDLKTSWLVFREGMMSTFLTKYMLNKVSKLLSPFLEIISIVLNRWAESCNSISSFRFMASVLLILTIFWDFIFNPVELKSRSESSWEELRAHNLSWSSIDVWPESGKFLLMFLSTNGSRMDWALTVDQGFKKKETRRSVNMFMHLLEC